jgi:hypothetical protein
MIEVAVYGIGALVPIVAITVQTVIGLRSAKRGDGTLVVWAKSGCVGGVAMMESSQR